MNPNFQGSEDDGEDNARRIGWSTPRVSSFFLVCFLTIVQNDPRHNSLNIIIKYSQTKFQEFLLEMKQKDFQFAAWPNYTP